MRAESWVSDADDPLGELPPDVREEARAILRRIKADAGALTRLVGDRQDTCRLIVQAVKPPKKTTRERLPDDLPYFYELRARWTSAPRRQKMAEAKRVAEKYGKRGRGGDPLDDETLTKHIKRAKDVDDWDYMMHVSFDLIEELERSKKGDG